ncbi:MAG TPA: ABC transporter substrate-binding protein [Patescibacteria group bacterium]|nr:ABC transporter substrate-binding protein [Patescibacteria group bacterium]
MRRNMHKSIFIHMVGVTVLAALVGCGGRQAVRHDELLPPACGIVSPPAERVDTVRVAMFDAPRPEHAPAATNDAERLLFRQLYETLITVDCLGVVRPALAESWERGDGGRRWMFELRDDARFWDGTPVTARDVVESWRYTALDQMTRGSGAGIGSMAPSAGIDSAVAADQRVLRVYFARPHREVPRALAAPAFAVAKSTWDSRWPHGSGPYRIVSSERDAPWKPWRTIAAHPAFGGGGPIIRFVTTSAADARDLLEGGIDLLVTADQAVIEYAAGQPQFDAVPLPYDRAYILCAPSRVSGRASGGAPATIPPALSNELARDAVRGDARGCEPPYWWNDLGDCGEVSPAVPWRPRVLNDAYPPDAERRILFDLTDTVARGLAERIVALAAARTDASADAAALFSALPGLHGGESGLRAEGVSERALGESLLDGGDFAYVVSVPRRPPNPCDAARSLMKRARWVPASGSDLSDAFIPLVETRPHVIVRKGTIGLLVDWSGDVLVINGTAGGR